LSVYQSINQSINQSIKQTTRKGGNCDATWGRSTWLHSFWA